MEFRTTWNVEPSDFKPVWTGYTWRYQRREYASLRLLKSRPSYKAEREFIKRAVGELRQAIDEDILAMVNDMNPETFETEYECTFERGNT